MLMMVSANAVIAIALNDIFVIHVWVRAMKCAISGELTTINMVSRGM